MDNETAIGGGAHDDSVAGFGVGLFCRCYDTNGRLVGYGLELEFGAVSPVSRINLASGERQLPVDIDRRIEGNDPPTFPLRSRLVEPVPSLVVIIGPAWAYQEAPLSRVPSMPTCASVATAPTWPPTTPALTSILMYLSAAFAAPPAKEVSQRPAITASFMENVWKTTTGLKRPGV